MCFEISRFRTGRLQRKPPRMAWKTLDMIDGEMVGGWMVIATGCGYKLGRVIRADRGERQTRPGGIAGHGIYLYEKLRDARAALEHSDVIVYGEVIGKLRCASGTDSAFTADGFKPLRIYKYSETLSRKERREIRDALTLRDDELTEVTARKLCL